MEKRLDIYAIITIIIIIIDFFILLLFLRLQKDIADFKKRQEAIIAEEK